MNRKQLKTVIVDFGQPIKLPPWARKNKNPEGTGLIIFQQAKDKAQKIHNTFFPGLLHFLFLNRIQDFEAKIFINLNGTITNIQVIKVLEHLPFREKANHFDLLIGKTLKLKFN